MKGINVFRLINKIINSKIGKKKLFSIDYLVTSRCNLKCSFCIRPMHAPELSTKEALKVVDNACRSEALFFQFSGGEPLLRKDLTILANRASDNGCTVGLSTNGVLINEGNAYEIADAFDQIYISLDGYVDIHDKNRGMKGTFKKVIEAIELLKIYGAKVGVNVIIAPWNIQILPEFIEWLHGRVEFIVAQPIHPYPPPYKLSHESICRLVDYLLSLKHVDADCLQTPIDFIRGIELFFDSKIPKICHAGEFYIGVDPVGNVLACPIRTDIILGNILDRPINEILNNRTKTSDWIKIIRCQGCWINCTTTASMILSKIAIAENVRIVSSILKKRIQGAVKRYKRTLE